jgi:hypothetical protein
MSGTEERLDPEATCGCGHLVKRHLDRTVAAQGGGYVLKHAGTCVACMGDSWCGGPRAMTPKRLSVAEATVIVDTLVLGGFVRQLDSAPAITHLLLRSGTFPDVDTMLDYACGPRTERVVVDPVTGDEVRMGLQRIENGSRVEYREVPIDQATTEPRAEFREMPAGSQMPQVKIPVYGDSKEQALRRAQDVSNGITVNAVGADLEAWRAAQPSTHSGPWRRLLDAVNEHRRRERGPRD